MSKDKENEYYDQLKFALYNVAKLATPENNITSLITAPNPLLAAHDLIIKSQQKSHPPTAWFDKPPAINNKALEDLIVEGYAVMQYQTQTITLPSKKLKETDLSTLRQAGFVVKETQFTEKLDITYVNYEITLPSQSNLGWINLLIKITTNAMSLPAKMEF